MDPELGAEMVCEIAVKRKLMAMENCPCKMALIKQSFTELMACGHPMRAQTDQADALREKLRRDCAARLCPPDGRGACVRARCGFVDQLQAARKAALSAEYVSCLRRMADDLNAAVAAGACRCGAADKQ
mmetsp:Transcript_17295/g.44066  ORF Transcript_17295/g.44066 Transcript_17295/m.44066 type:complete len:129 (-) Transcript_17295:150-536(-)